MKNRFSTLDLKASAVELQARLDGLRVANVYDVDNKTYLFKFVKPGVKIMLLIESGIRIHTTEFDWPKNPMPSSFAVKLRKHLRTRRVERIEQLGSDRILDMQFGSGEAAYHVILELYSKGNICLTDCNYTILNILRARTHDDSVRFAVNETYPFAMARAQRSVTPEYLVDILKGAKEKDVLKKVLSSHVDYGTALLEHVIIKAGLKPGERILNNSLFEGLCMDSPVIQSLHAACCDAEKIMKEIEGSGRKKGYVIMKKQPRPALTDSQREGYGVSGQPTEGGKQEPKDGTDGNDMELDEDGNLLVYDEFHPYVFAQHEDRPRKEFNSFDEAVDLFFSKTESQKLDLKALQMEKNALDKLETARQRHENRIKSLQKFQGSTEEKARYIEMNVDLVEKAISIILGFVAAGHDWDEIEDMVDEGKDNEDPVAMAISGLKLDKNMISMRLIDPYGVLDEQESDSSSSSSSDSDIDLENSEDVVFDDKGKKKRGCGKKKDKHQKGHHGKHKGKKKKEGGSHGSESSDSEDEYDKKKKKHGKGHHHHHHHGHKKGNKDLKGPKTVQVDIDLSLSGYANARKYYDTKKIAAFKEKKTMDVTEKAMKSAERKTKEALKEVAVATHINKNRKILWFEKFFWFITSENYIVIGGRDRQQNEIVVKKYMKKGDLYVHADVHGASSLVIKNPTGQPVPPKSLAEVGCMALCRSASWEAKAVTSAWWVYDHQVSKTAPTGEYLSTGGFMIRGKKNFLPPAPLVLGFGIMFKVDESSVFRHLTERRVKTLNEEEENVQKRGAGKDIHSLKDDKESERLAVDEGSSKRSKSPSKYGLEWKDMQGKETADKNEEAATFTDAASDDDGLMEYPDTSIQYKATAGGIGVSGAIGSGTAGGSSSGAGKRGSVVSITTSGAGEVSTGGDGGRGSTTLEDDFYKIDMGDGTFMSVRNSKPPNHHQQKDHHHRHHHHHRGGKGRGKHGRDGKCGKSTESLNEDDNDKNENTNGSTNVLNHNQLARGKKYKLKKMKEKYGEQDEDERQLRMQILGSAGPAADEHEGRGRGKKNKKKDKRNRHGGFGGGPREETPAEIQEKVKRAMELKSMLTERNESDNGDAQQDKSAGTERESENVSAEPGPAGEGEGGLTEDEVIGEGEDGDGEQKDSEGGMSKSAAKKQRKLQAKREIEHILETEGVQDIEDVPDDAAFLSSLTGCPHEEDVLLFAVPVCGPYSTLGNYKYRVKITPGTAKRGKAAKQAVSLFAGDSNGTGREKSLIKAIKDNELYVQLPAKVKMSAPNYSAKNKRK
eukprot:Nk52_evm1s514 gene=Nk52_evmTU1s514